MKRRDKAPAPTAEAGELFPRRHVLDERERTKFLGQLSQAQNDLRMIEVHTPLGSKPSPRLKELNEVDRLAEDLWLYLSESDLDESYRRNAREVRNVAKLLRDAEHLGAEEQEKIELRKRLNHLIDVMKAPLTKLKLFSEATYEQLKREKAGLEQKLFEARDRVREAQLEEEQVKKALASLYDLLGENIEFRSRDAKGKVRSDWSAVLTRAGSDGSWSKELISSGRRQGPAQMAMSAAEHVLRIGNRPLHYRELAEKVQNIVPLGGRDPSATLLAYLNKARDRFRRVAPGTYWVVAEELPEGEAAVSVSGLESSHAPSRSRSK